MYALWVLGRDQRTGKGGSRFRHPTPTLHTSRLKARMRRSRSPIFAAWKSSGWSIMDNATLRAAQMFPDITWWDCWRLRLFLWRLRAVRKLLAASLGNQNEFCWVGLSKLSVTQLAVCPAYSVLELPGSSCFQFPLFAVSCYIFQTS